ncbi:MAG: hypothetical protein FWC69_05460 [Defluviitaleaceae bacterium]|nr:hypothetical protein [Defluviitaleaceae bacterium]
MKKFKAILGLLALSSIVFLTACGGNGDDDYDYYDDNGYGSYIDTRYFTIDRVYVGDDNLLTTMTDLSDTHFADASLMFVGPEAGGAVNISLGGSSLLASINPSRSHPSFADGAWHHHLYASSTTSGSPRVNFNDAFSFLGTLGNEVQLDATDSTQSNFQRGNLHYIVNSGEFRLRIYIDGIRHDLMFVSS